MLGVQHQVAVAGVGAGPETGRPTGRSALSGQDETLGSNGAQVKSAQSGVCAASAWRAHRGADCPPVTCDDSLPCAAARRLDLLEKWAPRGSR
jgi:hypothetical protein